MNQRIKAKEVTYFNQVIALRSDPKDEKEKKKNSNPEDSYKKV